METVKKASVQIARALGLTNATSYTSHCFRRTGATLLADKIYFLKFFKRRLPPVEMLARVPETNKDQDS
jgi:hypothetical protein